MSKEKVFEELFGQQHIFTQYMRNPENSVIPDNLEPRRMSVYADLVFRNIESFIANSFPVLRQVIHDDKWYTIIRGFIKKHISKTPYFPHQTLLPKPGSLFPSRGMRINASTWPPWPNLGSTWRHLGPTCRHLGSTWRHLG